MKIILSLVTNHNEYQTSQAALAEETARRLNVDLQVLFADNDPVNQSHQVLQAIQANHSKPDGAIVFPVSDSGLAQAAKLAVSSGIGWAIIGRNVDYIPSLRATSSVPVFKVVTDHVEIGRIQARQIGALVPEGGMILYVQGPSGATSAADRLAGFNETKPSNIEFRALRAAWTQESAYEAMSGFLRLATSASLPVRAIVSQSDAMAMGVRKAIEERMNSPERERWLGLPLLGCDGVSQSGIAWVDRRLLKATVIHPLTAGVALEMLVSGLKSGKQPSETTVLMPSAYPAIESLRKK